MEGDVYGIFGWACESWNRKVRDRKGFLMAKDIVIDDFNMVIKGGGLQ